MAFTLLLYKALVFNFPERASPEKGWVSNGLFQLLCSFMDVGGRVLPAPSAEESVLSQDVKVFAVAVLRKQPGVALISGSHQGHDVTAWVTFTAPWLSHYSHPLLLIR